jgi:hypothetical protein
MVVEDKDVKIAETPREALINQALQISEKRILEIELTLELEKNALEYLKKL